MGILITVSGGDPVALISPVVDNYVVQAGLFRVWYLRDPQTVLIRGETNTDSPTPSVYAGSVDPSFLWTPDTPLQIRAAGVVWLQRETEWQADPTHQNVLANWTLKITYDGQISLHGPESDSEFWKGFAKGAVTWAVITTAVVLTAGAGAGVGAVGATPVTVAGSGFASEWTIATAGMGEGMSVGSSLAGIGSGVASLGGTVVDTAKSAAGAASALSTAVNTIRSAFNTLTNTSPQNTGSEIPQQNNMLFLGVGVVALILASKG